MSEAFVLSGNLNLNGLFNSAQQHDVSVPAVPAVIVSLGRQRLGSGIVSRKRFRGCRQSLAGTNLGNTGSC